MLERSLRTVALVLAALVLAGWGAFALEEARSASDQTATEIAGRSAARAPSPTAEQERAREAAHSDVRELVDDVNDVLLSPFAALADGADDQWVRRSVPAALALLLFGLGGLFLARAAAGR